MRGREMYLHLIGRKRAKEIGLKHYFTGLPCKNGNIDARYTPNSGCLCRQCRQQRRDIAAAADKNHWAKKLARAARYREKNREAVNERAKEYSKNSQDVRAAYVSRNSQRIKDNAKKYRKENRPLFNFHCNKRKGERLKRTPVWYGDLDDFIFKEAAIICAARKEATGLEWHIDHAIPLMAEKASGLHCFQNIQVIPGYINKHKKNRMMITEPFEWIKFI